MLPVRATLRLKLFLSHLLVVLAGIVALFVTAQLLAPAFFARHMRAMAGGGPGMMGAGGNGAGALDAAFRAALFQALLLAAAVAGMVALLATLFVSRRIAGPLKRMVAATQRVAAGRYAERVPTEPANAGDELGALATSFNAMAASLERTEERRIALIGDISHELRTPIATLEGYLEGLLDGVVAPRPETWALLHGEAGRLRRLVDDLQELSRAEAQQVALSPQPLLPDAIIQTAIDRLAAQFAESDLTLQATGTAHLPAVWADRDRAIQVLTNLLTNALRYTPAPGQVTVTAASDARAVTFRVTDSGIGFPPEEAPRLFERFYRVEKSRSRASGGSGIGLTIARALVEAMGGEIAASSPGPGQGSTFSFTLPRAP